MEYNHLTSEVPRQELTLVGYVKTGRYSLAGYGWALCDAERVKSSKRPRLRYLTNLPQDGPERFSWLRAINVEVIIMRVTCVSRKGLAFHYKQSLWSLILLEN